MPRPWRYTFSMRCGRSTSVAICAFRSGNWRSSALVCRYRHCSFCTSSAQKSPTISSAPQTTINRFSPFTGSWRRGRVHLQIAAVLTLWVHACIGLHFWLRTNRWYPAWLPIIGTVAVLIPALHIAGYISGGNQILREAQDIGFLSHRPKQHSRNAETVAQVWHMALIGLSVYAGLVFLPFAGRAVRGIVYRLHRPPQLTHAGGRTMAMLPGATVLEPCAPMVFRTLRCAAVGRAAPPAASVWPVGSRCYRDRLGSKLQHLLASARPRVCVSLARYDRWRILL